MAIVDLTYYTSCYLGEPVVAADFPRFEMRAEQVIANLTRGQYAPTLAKLTALGNIDAANALTTAYKNAICAQIEYYAAAGLLSVSTGSSGDSFTVGKVTVRSGETGFKDRGVAMVSPAAQAYLEQTGLLGRHLSVESMPFAPYPWEVW